MIRFLIAVFSLLSVEAFAVEVESLRVGAYQSRALLRSPRKQITPAVILVPGSGPHGPEEWMPRSLTANGKDLELLGSFARALNASGVTTLQLGKPGVNSRAEQERSSQVYYDIQMYQKLNWPDLVENVISAVTYLKSRPNVDPDRIYLLGHSEGTQVAIDVAERLPNLKGLILLSFSGEDMRTTLDYQIFQREIEWFLKPELDPENTGRILRSRAEQRPDLHLPWKPHQDSLTFEEIEEMLRADPGRRQFVETMRAQPLYQRIFDRGPIYDKAARLPQDLFVFTGSLDVQTPVSQTIQLRDVCLKSGKTNCAVTVVKDVGHGFSPPRAPRCQALLDATIGPPVPEFLQLLTNLGASL